MNAIAADSVPATTFPGRVGAFPAHRLGCRAQAWNRHPPEFPLPTARVDDPGVETVVQWVRTSWTKQSRGGVGAGRRNATPVAFPLPGDQASPYVHEIVMREQDGFQPRATVRPGPPASDEAVLLSEADGLLRILPAVTPFGMPSRWRRPPVVRLAPGEWVRWQINYRFPGSCDGEWIYRQDTLNLLNGHATDPRIFLGDLTRRVDELALLR